MTSILRNFFYSFGLAMLCSAWMMNPETAEFKDMLALLHEPAFLKLVGLFALTLIGAEMIFSKKVGIPARRGDASAAASTRPR